MNGLDIVGENALIYAGLGYVYWFYVNAGYYDHNYLEKAEEYVKKAFVLEPGITLGHVVQGMIYNLRGDQIQYLNHLKKSLDKDPNDPDALLWLSIGYALAAGNSTAALPLVEKLIKIDPLNVNSYGVEGLVHFFSGQFDLSLKSFSKVYQMDPTVTFYHIHYAQLLVLHNSRKDAFDIIEKAITTFPDDPIAQLGVLFKSACQGDKSKLNSMSKEFRAWISRDPFFPTLLVDDFALLDEKEEALNWLELAINRGNFNYPFFNEHDPFIDNIRDERRFKKLMEDVKHKWENFEI
jgi:tetratricopeptide (TPR) repeat protein